MRRQASPTAGIMREETDNNAADAAGPSESFDEEAWDVQPAPDARPILPKAAFFLGDLRDGLPMVCCKLKETE
jgi:hypothetical protein